MRGEGCRARGSALSRSFHPRELFRNAGTAGGNLPSEWVAEDGFLFRHWRETDFHQVNVWYVYNGRLIDPEAVIELTDLDSDSGYLFQFTYSTIQRGSYRLGDPRRSFSY